MNDNLKIGDRYTVRFICPYCGSEELYTIDCAWREINCANCWADVICEPTPDTDPLVWDNSQ
jgi:transcription elongation factor Elf1